MRGREAAWWVHPKTGEVVPVQYHAKAIADHPSKFGLSLADVRKHTAGSPGFDGRRVNPLNKQAGSAAVGLIGAATKNGWVRVRHMNPTGVAVEATGDHGHLHKAIGALEKHGVKFRGKVTLDDPQNKFTKTFPSHEHLKSASKTGALPNFNSKAPATATDAASRMGMRARLYAQAGLSMEEKAALRKRTKAIKEAMTLGTTAGSFDPLGANPVADGGADGDDSRPLDTPFAGKNRAVPKSGPTLAAAIAKRLQARKTDPASPPPLPQPNEPPAISTNDQSQALQMPADLR